MWKYVSRRLLSAIVVLAIMSMIDFWMINLAPGDPLQAMLPPTPRALSIYKQLYHQYGLDQSIPVRYVEWVVAVLHGHWGTSFQTQQPVGAILLTAIPNTLLLAGTALLLSLLIGIPLGVLAASKGSVVDELIRLLSFVTFAIQPAFLAAVVVFVFAVTLHWFPANGMSEFNAQNSVLDVLDHLVLPASVLGLLGAPAYAQYVRTSLLDVLQRDYLRTARAKGLRERTITWVHAFPNALGPLVTVLGLSLPAVLGGSLFIEVVFAWPGLGQESYRAATLRDYPVFMATSLLYALAVLVGNLVADLLYAVVDPRVRYD